MLSVFLRETSIHGLRYLVEAKNPVVKFLWLACICLCFGSAVLIIYLNVKNWENTPAVVTSVQPSLVKVRKLPDLCLEPEPMTGDSFQNKPLMPMVTVCPQFANLNNLIYNLLEKDPQCAGEEAVTDLANGLVLDYVRKRIFAWKVPSNKMKSARPMFNVCKKAERVEGEDCQFVLLLSAVAKLKTTGVYADLSFVHEYIANKTIMKEKPTLEDLQQYVEGLFGNIDLDDGKHVAYNYYFEVLIDLYASFFPVFKDAEKKTFEKLKGLDEYEPPETMQVSTKELGSLLAHLMDRNLMGDAELSSVSGSLSKRAAVILFNCLGSYFDMTDYHDIYSIINAYNFFPNAYFGFKSNYDLDPCQKDGKNLREICSTPVNEKCTKYCSLVQHGHTPQDKIRDIFLLGLDKIGTINDSNPHIFLPECQYPGLAASSEGCWMQSVTDHGMCFSTLSGLFTV